MTTAVQNDSRFPLPYGASIAQWWNTSATSGLASQHKILSLSPFFSKPDWRTASQSFFKLKGGKDRFLNEVVIKATAQAQQDGELSASQDGVVQSASAPASTADNHMVVLHGYGAGLGLFFRNFEGLSQLVSRKWDIYALDWLGMGLSGRPAFKVHAKDAIGKIREAEDFFLDALEEWREARRLERMTLVAHSLGGYLAVRYANKYPDRVERLVLVSPVGIPANPYEPKQNTKPEPTLDTAAPDTTLVNEFEDVDAPVQKQPLPRWVTTLWDANVSPFSFVRFGTMLGPKVVSGWTFRRFGHLPVDQRELLHSYAYEIFRAKGSGEYALAYLLAPGAYARDNLLKSLPTHCPTLLLYGDRDWMDEGAGRRAAQIANAKGGNARVEQISSAGHHCYLDNPKEFDQVVLDFVGPTRQ